MNEVATIQESTAPTPARLLEIAVSKGAEMAQLKELMDLQERWEANEARKAYAAAMAAFKKETIEILKNKKVEYENNDKTTTTFHHATLDHVVEVAAPLLAKHGVSHKWSTSQGEGGRITVTCVLTHELGHRESESLSASPDDSGRKNNIQRMSSAVTYLERYTFMAITGLAAKGHDDDGAGSGELTDEDRKKVYEEGVTAGCQKGQIWFKYYETIAEIKDRLADNDLAAAAEALYSIPNNDLAALRRAPTKGGIFTLEETKKMSGDDWVAVVEAAVKANPDVDRSM